MDYLSHNIGINLKHIRKSKKMSLDIVSEQTGVSKSMLAQIEKGEANPSIGVLGKIASGLRIEIQDLICTPQRDTYLIHTSELIPTKESEGRYKVFTYFPIQDNGSLEIYRIDIEPGCVYSSGGHGEKTREYIIVTEGVLTLECEGGSYDITIEDAFRFESDRDHFYKNEGNTRVSFLTFFMEHK
jgi:transcriptional regulator with XRE-family HTH domain